MAQIIIGEAPAAYRSAFSRADEESAGIGRHNDMIDSLWEAEEAVDMFCSKNTFEKCADLIKYVRTAGFHSIKISMVYTDKQGEAIRENSKKLDSALREASKWVVFVLKGDALLSQRKYSDAIAEYDKALKVHPNAAVALFGKGVALAELGRYSSAIETLEKANRLFVKKGDTERAKASAETLAQLKKHIAEDVDSKKCDLLDSEKKRIEVDSAKERVSVLIQCLKNKDMRDRVGAQFALESFAKAPIPATVKSQMVNDLVKILMGSNSIDVRMTAAIALGSVLDEDIPLKAKESALDPLIKATRDKDARLRSFAASAMEGLISSDEIPLSTKERMVRPLIQVAEAATGIDGFLVASAIRELAALDISPEAKRELTKALDALGPSRQKNP